MKQTTNAERFDSTAVGREIAIQLIQGLSPEAKTKLQRIRAQRAQAMSAKGEKR
ncbi:hypothetical protein [Marinobacterium stanieri]|uniref:Uncharacterized protein n=1 Tax=Marinobacterium stanieri TaxID=49186 RepID=A0A1N6Q450_9GAMM|nr:hypothetical protein [Marinobacterium stanieri]SIQ11363.1 hypothetical protein SAMN05421647_102243 [Marinobacterium stanieri]